MSIALGAMDTLAILGPPSCSQWVTAMFLTLWNPQTPKSTVMVVASLPGGHHYMLQNPADRPELLVPPDICPPPQPLRAFRQPGVAAFWPLWVPRTGLPREYVPMGSSALIAAPSPGSTQFYR
jgi:hypothetical protein